MNILIVKLSSIGDIVHAMPAVALLRRNLPDAHLSWVVERRSAEILRGSKLQDSGRSLVDEIIEIDTRSIRAGRSVDEIVGEISRQSKAIRGDKYDVAIDMQGLIKSAAIAKISGAKRRVGFAKEILREKPSRFLMTDTVEIEPKTHIIHRNIRLALGALELKIDSPNIEFPIAANAEHVTEADEIVGDLAEDFALLNPAGGWVTKLWHAEKFGAMADMIWENLGIRSIVATAPNEAELADRVLRSSTSGKVTLSQPSLKGFFELAKRASVYVGGDTGPTHIAIAAAAPTIGIFGPTEWWRNGSLSPGDICVERNDIDCRVDCHRRTCSKWICMDIEVETVFKAVKARLESLKIVDEKGI